MRTKDGDATKRFLRDVFRLLWQYRGLSVLVLGVTIGQELSSLWPYSSLGKCVDKFQSKEIFLAVVVFVLANGVHLLVSSLSGILRNTLKFDLECFLRIKLVSEEGGKGIWRDAKGAGRVNTLILNAISGLVQAADYLLGSFIPVLIKIGVVSADFMRYSWLLALAYLLSLLIPGAITIYINRKLLKLRDLQYKTDSLAGGEGVQTLLGSNSEGHNQALRDSTQERKRVQISLTVSSQVLNLLRTLSLAGSQLIVIFLAVYRRQELGLTAGDFTRLINYMVQVAGSFLGVASMIDALATFSRAHATYKEET